MTFFQSKAYDFGCGVAALLWPFFRKRRQISIDNILRAKITDSLAEARRIAKTAFCHFIGHLAEAVFVPRVITRDNWREHLDFSDATPMVVKTLLDSPNTPVLLVSGHHGCWEAATNLIPFARPMVVVARMVDNRFLRSWMQKHQFRGPVTLVNKNRGFRERFLRQWIDEKAAFTMLMDQYAGRKGALVRFFGRPARTVTSAARLAIRTGCPVVVGSFVRIAPYVYRLVGDDPIVFPKETNCEAATQVLNDRIEKAVRRYPEQYLWMHRRWRDD